MAILANYDSQWLSPPPPPTNSVQGNFLITEQKLVNYAAQGVTYYITNLSGVNQDAQLLPHYTSRGISKIYDFVNNGDGTGSFKADLLENYLVYTFVLYTIDSLGEPYNSGYAASYAQTEATTGDTFLLYPKVYPKTYLFYSMMDNIPQTRFLNVNQPFTVPYSTNKTSFNFEVKETGKPVTVTTQSLTNKTEVSKVVIIPDRLKFTYDIKLSKGTNLIQMFTDTEEYKIYVACTTFAVWLDTYAEEIYNYVVFFLENQYVSILSNFSSTLAMPLFKEEFQDVFPNSSVYTAVAMRMYAKSLLNNTSKQKGFTDLFKGFFQNNPLIIKNESEYNNFNFITNPLYNDGELFSGNDIHFWSDNYCIASWHLFKKYLVNTKQSVISATKNKAVFYDNNDELQYALFSLQDSNCSVFEEFLTEELCYDGLDVELAGELFWNIQFCINYPFDSILYNVDPPSYDNYDIKLDIGTLLTPLMEPYSNLTGNNLSFFITPQKDYNLSFSDNICYSENNEPYVLLGKNLYLSLINNVGTIINSFTINFTIETTVEQCITTINNITGSDITASSYNNKLALKATHDNLYISMEGMTGVTPTYNALSILGNFYIEETITFPAASTASGVVSAVNSLSTDIRSFKETVYSYTCVNVGPYLSLPLTTTHNNNLRIEGLREDGTVLDTTIFFDTESTTPQVVTKINTDCPYVDILATSGTGGEVKLYTINNTTLTNITGNSLTEFGNFNPTIEGYKVLFETKDMSPESNLKLDFSGTNPLVSSAFGFTGFTLGKTQTKRDYTLMIEEKAHIVSTIKLPFALSGVMSLYTIPQTNYIANYGTNVCYTGFKPPFTFNGNNVPSELIMGTKKVTGATKYYTINLTTETTSANVVSSVNAIVTGSEFVAFEETDGRISFTATDPKDSIIAKVNTFGFTELGNIVIIDNVLFKGDSSSEVIKNRLTVNTDSRFTAYNFYEDSSKYLTIAATDRNYDTQFYIPVLEEDNIILLSAMGYSFIAPSVTDKVTSEISSEEGFDKLSYISRFDSGSFLDSFVPRQVAYGLTTTILTEPFYNLNDKYLTVQYMSADNVSFSIENIQFTGVTFVSAVTNTAEEIAEYINKKAQYLIAYPKGTGKISLQVTANEDDAQIRILQHPTASSLYAFGWNDYFSTNKGDFTIGVVTACGFTFTKTDGSLLNINLDLSATTYTAELLAEHITNTVGYSGTNGYVSMAQAEIVGDTVVVRCIRTDYLMTFNTLSGGYIALGGFTKGEVAQTSILLPCAISTGPSVSLGIVVDKTLMIEDLVSCSGGTVITP